MLFLTSTGKTTMLTSQFSRTLFAVTFLISSTVFAKGIGNVTEQTGPAEISRAKSKLPSEKGADIFMQDVIQTAKSKVGITFADNTKIRIIEQSKLIVDEFIYDPGSETPGKLGMKVVLGTVRYASGKIAKDNAENVNIQTPTATIAVRGTDFTMTVDEIGRSLVILLPSCPTDNEVDCYVGEIEVLTDVGAVIMNQAFQATLVTSSDSMPTEPTIVNITEALIDNFLIISPPEEVRIAQEEQERSKDPLDKDLLKFDDLDTNQLDEEDELANNYELDINYLDFDFLGNMLDLTTVDLNRDQLETNETLPTIQQYSWILWYANEEEIFMRSERPPHVAEISLERVMEGNVNITQDDVPAQIQVQGGSGTEITIIQSQ